MKQAYLPIIFDPQKNLAYISLGKSASAVTTISITPNILLDLDSEGLLVGIELLNASAHLHEIVPSLP